MVGGIAMRTSILLVDDHKIMRDGLSVLSEKQPDMEVVGEAENGRGRRQARGESWAGCSHFGYLHAGFERHRCHPANPGGVPLNTGHCAVHVFRQTLCGRHAQCRGVRVFGEILRV